MDGFIQRCWCGNHNLTPFSPQYLKCPACETLIAAWMQENQGNQLAGRQKDFYDRGYWFIHQKKDLHQPDIIQRARQDLPQRCLHWLRTVLKYKLPPASAMEIGSAHGGFVALLRFLGFDAMGLEVDPWVVDFSRNTFHIPMLLGPLEEQQLEPGSLDMVILMDVLEHLPYPEKTMGHCLRLLKPNGIFVIQTPCLPEGKTYEDLESQGDRFLEMMVEKEHLYLFSRSSMQEFFHRLQIDYIESEPAIFAQYDMFLVGSRTHLHPHSKEEIEKFLGNSPDGRMVQALFDLDLQGQELLQKYTESEADRAARLEIINQLTRQMQALERSLLFRGLRKLGFFGQLNHENSPILPAQNTKIQTDPKHPLIRAIPEISRISRIAVDLTPLLPGAENGGAKLLATELVRHLSSLLPDSEFILLTSERSHEELSLLDAPNVRRVCMANQKISIAPPSPMQNRPPGVRLREWAARSLPSPLHARGKAFYRSLRALRRFRPGILSEMGVNLLFCPFTAPFYYDSEVPVVSIIYDLQFHYYPQFFEREDRHSRENNFQITCRLADRLVCISEYVRGTVLKNSDRTPEEVITVPIRLFTRLRKLGLESVQAIIEKYRLGANEFLLYPANFWPHKNHPMLFTAFAMYRSRHPESSLKLFCTGSSDVRMDNLREAARRMGMEEWIFLPGYLSDEEFSALLSFCRALIFPSLYEGFGMPVLEAMSFGRPVLCSNIASLPEVGGDAALYFDPRNPEAILAGIERIMAEPELTASLVERGSQRVSSFGNPRQMAREYVHVFRGVLEKRCRRRTSRMRRRRNHP